MLRRVEVKYFCNKSGIFRPFFVVFVDGGIFVLVVVITGWMNEVTFQ